MTTLAECPHCRRPILVQTATRILAATATISTAELVVEIVAEHGPVHGRAVATLAHRRAADVYRSLHDAQRAGRIRHTASGWVTA
jgi:hypothetical protein